MRIVRIEDDKGARFQDGGPQEVLNEASIATVPFGNESPACKASKYLQYAWNGATPCKGRLDASLPSPSSLLALW